MKNCARCKRPIEGDGLGMDEDLCYECLVKKVDAIKALVSMDLHYFPDTKRESIETLDWILQIVAERFGYAET